VIAAPPPLHTDAAEVASSPFDLVSARFGQDHDKLVLDLKTARTWKVADVSPRDGRTLCVLLFTRAGHTRACAARGGEGETPLVLRWARLNDAGHPVQSRTLPGTVTHPDARTLHARFTAADARIAPGRYRWRAQSRWAADSVDELPDHGTIPARYTPPVTGCAPSGPGELRHGPAGHKRVALTFDDGPDQSTAAMLDLLEREKVPATFFIIGRQVAGRTALLKRMLRDGDMLGNHTWAHTRGGGGIAETNAAIRDATGFTPCLFRPPFGDSSPALVAQVTGMGMRSILWDVDPQDWRYPGADAIVSNVLANVHDGAIVLSHDGGGPRDQTIAAYAQIIPALKHRGYKLVTVPELLGYKPT